jgi:hypothetical protein
LNAGPAGLATSLLSIHALTGVAIECRPCGPEN